MSISIKNLSKSFDGKPVLTGFSCELPEKGVIALMGRSGIGKSTLINLLLGLRKPDSGEIILPAGMRFSAVFQEDRLLPHLSARENLLLTTGRAQADINAALTALSLNKMWGKLAGKRGVVPRGRQLSGSTTQALNQAEGREAFSD